MSLFAYGRLIKAGFILVREGALSIIDTNELPSFEKSIVWFLRHFERNEVKKTGSVERLNKALHRLGPTYVKFGQILATRPDIVGMQISNDLSSLQDAMDPFDESLVPKIIKDALGERAKDIIDLSAPIAAASIAQVHKAKLKNADGNEEIVAIKILRPGVEQRFAKDIKSYYAGARLLQRFIPVMKRLNPIKVVEILDRSAKLELDLRFEAASISEFMQNTHADEGFATPIVKWQHIAQNVMVTSWVDGVPIRNIEAIDRAGIDRKKLATHLMQSFLRHAIRDGFFHADMHPGNLFADPKTHGIIAVDFGIMGRIKKQERRFLANLIYGFIKRDYYKIAKLHFDIGYVPKTQSVDEFALALRSIGEPLQGQMSRDISMAKMLGQLLAITEIFDMATRPELVLLQKTMVLVEGVARSLDDDLNFWLISEPIVRDWLIKENGPQGMIERAKENFDILNGTIAKFPAMIERADVIMADIEKQKSNGNNNKWLFFIASTAVLVAFWGLMK